MLACRWVIALPVPGALSNVHDDGNDGKSINRRYLEAGASSTSSSSSTAYTPMPPGHPAVTPLPAPTHAAASMQNTPLTMPSPSISQQQAQLPLHGPVAAAPSSVAAKPQTWLTPAPCKEPVVPATTIDLATTSTIPAAIPPLDHGDCGEVAGPVHKCDKCGRHMHPFCGEKLGEEGLVNKSDADGVVARRVHLREIRV